MSSPCPKPSRCMSRNASPAPGQNSRSPSSRANSTCARIREISRDGTAPAFPKSKSRHRPLRRLHPSIQIPLQDDPTPNANANPKQKQNQRQKPISQLYPQHTGPGKCSRRSTASRRSSTTTPKPTPTRRSSSSCRPATTPTGASTPSPWSAPMSRGNAGRPLNSMALQVQVESAGV